MQNHRDPAAHLLLVVLPSDLHPFPPRVNPPAPLSLSAQAARFPSVAIPFTVPSFALCETRVRYSLLDPLRCTWKNSPLRVFSIEPPR